MRENFDEKKELESSEGKFGESKLRAQFAVDLQSPTDRYRKNMKIKSREEARQLKIFIEDIFRGGEGESWCWLSWLG